MTTHYDPVSKKKIVHYTQNKYDLIAKGLPAQVYPVDHPDSTRVSNRKQVLTSKVIKIHSNGFETENTRYKAYHS
jgi:hypothetical protein